MLSPSYSRNVKQKPNLGPKVIVWGFIGTVALCLLLILPVKILLQAFLIWITGLGIFWGPIIFIFVYTLVTVLFLPAVLLSIAAGFIYGTILGSIIVQLGSLFGACASFIIGKYFLQECVSRLTESYPMYSAIDKAISLNSWKIVTLLRLSPLTPFNVLNYGLALTRIKFWDYTWSSAIGMIPQSILFVYMGTAVKNISDLSENQSNQSPLSQFLFYFGLVVSIITAIGITFITSKAIKKELREAEQKKLETRVIHI